MSKKPTPPAGLPEGWQLMRLKYAVSSIQTGDRDSSYTPTGDDSGVLSIGGEHFNKWGEWKLDSPRYISRDMYNSLKNGVVEEGDVLMVKDGATIGKIAYVDAVPNGEAAVNSHVYVLKPSDSVRGELLSHFLRSSWVQTQIDQLIRGSAQAGLPATFADNVWIPHPPDDLQKQLISHVSTDYKRVRKAISQTEELVSLLEERRFSEITARTTYGLDESSTTKSDSRWFDELPRNWDSIRVKFVSDKIEQGWSPQCKETPSEWDEWGVLKTGCVNNMEFDPSENKKLPRDLNPKPDLEVNSGDVLMSRANTRALVGSCALVEDEANKLMMSDKLYRISLREDLINPKYFVYVMNSAPSREQIELEASGASKSMVNISQQFVQSMWIPLPSIEEQNKIVEYLDTQLERYSQLRMTLSELITLLKEYYRSLLSDAITGQINLSDWQQPDTQGPTP